MKAAEANYKQAVSEFNDAQRQADALETEALKAITGENRPDPGVANFMLLIQKARLDAAAKKKAEAKVLPEMEKNSKKANEVQAGEILNRAGRFGDAGYEARHLVAAQLADRIEIWKNDGYVITIHRKNTG